MALQLPEEDTQFGVTVRALKPFVLPNLYTNGQKIAQYPVRVKVTTTRRVKITKQELFEKDGGSNPDDSFFSMEYDEQSVTPNEAWEPAASRTYRRFDGDSDPWVELYHRITFQVISADGFPSASKTVESPVLEAFV